MTRHILPLQTPKRADAGALLECLGEALKLAGVQSVLDKVVCFPSQESLSWSVLVLMALLSMLGSKLA